MADALVYYDEEEAVFTKPVGERIWYAAFLLFAVCFLWMLIVLPYTGTPTDKDHLPLDCVMAFLVILPLSFAAGPREVRFDLRQKRYRVKQGLLFFSWTLKGDFSDISHFAYWNSLKVTAVTIEWKNKKRPQTTLTRCKTGSEAQALAEKLAVSVGVPIKDGYQRGIKKSAR